MTARSARTYDAVAVDVLLHRPWRDFCDAGDMNVARFLFPLAVVSACGLAAGAGCSDASTGGPHAPAASPGQGGSGNNGGSSTGSTGATGGNGSGEPTATTEAGAALPGSPASGGGTPGSPGAPSGTGSGGGDDSGTASILDAGLLADGGDPLDEATNPFIGLPIGANQLAVLCARKNGDAVSKAFCGPTPPVITSLVDLQKLLGLDFKAGNIGNGTGGNPAFVLTGHSTSLVTQFTSAINPRAIIFTPPNSRGRVNNPKPLTSFIAMGFVRGEEFVELVSNDPTANAGAGDLRFFLFNFAHPCTASATGCTNGDLLTPAVESNFTGVYSLYQEDDIKDTIFDCQQCHQSGGPTTAKILRMQELQNPWGHFFRNNRINGQVLLADYQAAHGTSETYAGIPGAVIFNPNQTNNNGNVTTGGGPDPAALEGLVENQGFKNQPNEYTTGTILKEVQAVNPNQPGQNVPAGTSKTWEALYANSMAGLDIPVPYHDIKVTDPLKLASATSAYQAVMAGTTPAAQLPDIRDVFLDSALSDLSFQPAAGLDGQGILVQMCQQCHNASLDQTESRERFRVDQLSQMTPAEKNLAIHRLNLPATSFRRMPPPRFRTLSPAEIEAVTQTLSQ